MFKAILLVAMMVASLPSMAIAQNGCPTVDTSYQQCNFTLTSSENKTVKVFKNSNSETFTGAIIATCKNGSYLIGKSACAPVNPSDCSIGPANWYGADGKSCGHDFSPEILKDGAERTIRSASNSGSITYSCDTGTVSAGNMLCSSGTKKEIPASQAQLTTQSITSTTASLAFFSSFNHTVSPGSVSANALSKCMNIQGFNVSDGATYTFYNKDSQNNGYHYFAKCKVTADLRCDQGVVIADSIGGDYNPKSGELDIPPSGVKFTKECVANGFPKFEKKLYLGASYPGVIDDFTAILICSNNQSKCSAPVTGGGGIISPLSCTEAKVTSGLLEVPRGTTLSPDDILNNTCKPLGFDSLKTILRDSKEDSSGGFDYRSVMAECGTYRLGDTAPLMPSCAAGGSTDGVASVTPLSCDTGKVERNIRGERSPSSGLYTLSPSDGTVRLKLCNESNYSTLSGSPTKTQFPSSDLFSVVALCSGYTGASRGDCEVMGPCFGPVVSAASSEPKLEYNGQFYKNLCAPLAPPTAGLCEGCSVGPFSFTDKINGNTCSITSPAAYSSQQNTVSFADTSINGSAVVLCNSGSKSLVSGSCYKSCPGGVSIGWADKNGGSSCSQTIPSGVYSNNQVITLASSVTNTGNAKFSCNGNTGAWVANSTVCKLDCQGNVNWGSGTSGGGTSKLNACMATLPKIKDGAVGVLTSSASGTSGSGNYRCDDGNLVVTNPVCNLACAATAGSWGGACKGSVSALNHGASSLIYHGGNPTHPYSSTITGSSTYSCSDGSLNQSGSSCSFVNSTAYDPWSLWSETSRSCSLSPDVSTVNSGVSFTQTKTCSVGQRQTQAVFHVWNDGRRDLIRTDVSSRTITEITTALAVGTKVFVSGSSVDLGPWVNTGGLFACGAWSPVPSNQQANFTQWSLCLQKQVQTVSAYTDYSNGTRILSGSSVNYQDIGSWASRLVTVSYSPPVYVGDSLFSAYSPAQNTICSGVSYQASQDYVQDYESGYIFTAGGARIHSTTSLTAVPKTRTQTLIGTKNCAPVFDLNASTTLSCNGSCFNCSAALTNCSANAVGQDARSSVTSGLSVVVSGACGAGHSCSYSWSSNTDYSQNGAVRFSPTSGTSASWTLSSQCANWAVGEAYYSVVITNHTVGQTIVRSGSVQLSNACAKSQSNL
jgi:hypothetical protein